MYISRLCLQNYRCYDNFEIDFNKELTVIVAENGKGQNSYSRCGRCSFRALSGVL